MIIGRPLKTKNLELPELLKLNNSDIKRVNKTKSLGMIVDEKLNWDEQFKRTTGKMGVGLAALKKIKNIVPQSQLCSVYYTLIESHLRYAGVIWGSLSKTKLASLQRLQDRVCSIISNAHMQIKFLSNKGCLAGNDISLVKNNRIVTEDKELVEIFNDHYMNIVEKSCSVKPCNIANALAVDDERKIIGLIFEKYKDHPSILAINQNAIKNLNSFSFLEVDVCQVRKELKSLDGKKSTGEDQIPPKLVLLAADELALPLTNAINSSIRNYKFPENGKRAAVCPLDKGETNRTVERNFRPVSVLNVFSKIYEKILKNQLIPYLDETLSLFIAAYRKSYGTQHDLIRMVEEWRIKLDNDYIV